MGWPEDIQPELDAYDAKAYADNTGGTTASYKLLRSYGANTAAEVPVHRRDRFEHDLNHRSGACTNLANSRAVRPEILRWP